LNPQRVRIKGILRSNPKSKQSKDRGGPKKGFQKLKRTNIPANSLGLAGIGGEMKVKGFERLNPTKNEKRGGDLIRIVGGKKKRKIRE